MSSAVTIVLLDANILYSRTLRDWIGLLQCEAPSLFTVVWTEDIMVETLYHLRKNNPLWSEKQIGGLRRQFEAAFTGGQITGYQIDTALTYPDIGDAHVHAAAVHGAVDILVTKNGKDFPYSDDLPYEIYEPDDFLVLVDDAAPQAVRAVTESQLRYYHQKCSSDEGVDLPLRLKKAEAPKFAARVREHLQHMDMKILAPHEPMESEEDASVPS
ncbi:PIN domain-containing protein [Paenarthrobacter nitroguajacolicus]|uniref:PIN domain-containing protein n=1 Tax=Paenarthrobacter nitroguajacolicus TaxID=211146 RepID=A0A558GYI7_PAENT|nr:PIN domain-containing protein [Paenarthrobacter nitroguajacolicus]TVU61951.1 PIN domain-containing protein [Paenarthrobacter nitroguajacolicus]